MTQAVPAGPPAVSGDVLGTPAPVMRTDRVASLMKDVWRLRVGTVRQLSSERDANILLDDRYVLKVSNPAEDPAVVDMENAAMAHAARVAADLPLPPVIPAASGASVTSVTDDTAQRAWPASSPSSRAPRPKAGPSPPTSPGRSALSAPTSPGSCRAWPTRPTPRPPA